MPKLDGDGWTFDDLTAEARAAVVKQVGYWMEAAAVIVRDEVVLVMEQSTPSGKTYLVPSTRTPYTASAPGEPPAIREATYRNSWKWSPSVEHNNEVVAYAFTDLLVGTRRLWVLGELLEYGWSTSDGPRPHVRPAIDRAVPKVKQLMESAST